MRQRIMLGSLALLAGLVFALAQAQNQPNVPKSKAGAEQAIRKATDAYVAEFNKGNVDAMLSIWADGAEYVDDAGKSTKGKAALNAMFTKALNDNKGMKVKITTTSIRLLKDDVAMQDGVNLMSYPNGDTDSNPFTTVWMKKDGQWLVQVVHDLAAPAETNVKGASSAVRDLAWLIGEWTNEDKDMKTTVTGRWLKADKYLAIDYVVRNQGEEVLSLTQVIGWDPIAKMVHSWVFDSRGGFGEGAWTREGNVWTVATSGVTSDGRQGTGKMLWTMVDNDHFIHEALDRNLDGQPLPDRKTKYERVKNAN